MRNWPAFLLGEVGYLGEFLAGLRLHIERGDAQRIGPGLIIGDTAAGAVVVEDHRPRDLLVAVGRQAELVGEVAEAVGIADDRHAILIAVAILHDGGALPVVGGPVPQRELRLLLVDRQIDALRPQNVLGAGFENEDVDLVAQLRGHDIAQEDADRVVGAGEFHVDADRLGHRRPVLQLGGGHAISAHRRLGRMRSGREAAHRAQGRGASHGAQHVAPRQFDLRSG